MQHPGQNVNWERVCARPPINPTIVTYEILGALQQSRTCQNIRGHMNTFPEMMQGVLQLP